VPEEDKSDMQADEEAKPAVSADEAEPAIDVVTAPAVEPLPSQEPPVAEGDAPEPAVPVQVEQAQPVPLSRTERERYDRQRRRFAACGRCGYFVADCLLLVGEQAFQKALLSVRDDWIAFDGDEAFRRLLVNAYGVELDIDYDYFDGSCPECRRRFIFTEHENGSTHLKLQP
jgi:hypothetical protein